MKLPEKVTIIEVGPRDGFQNLKKFIDTDDKVDIINMLCDTGISRIETTAFVNPKAVPQMRDAIEITKRMNSFSNVRFMVLVPNVRGAELALSAGAREINVVLSASESHNMSNCRMTIAESLKEFERIVSMAEKENCWVRASIATALGCPFEGKIKPSRVGEIAKELNEAGAKEILIADTSGMANPVLVQRVIEEVRSVAGDIDLVVHLHNTRETGMANILAAMLMGVTKMETSVGGLGGCPFAPGATGNVATEDLVNMLDDMGIETGIDLDKLISCARKVQGIIGHPINSAVAKAGSTYSGISFGCTGNMSADGEF